MRCGKTATSAANSPTPSPSKSSNTFSIATRMANVRAGKPAARSRANSPRRSKHVPPLHDRQPDRAQQEPQPAETLERGEIRVLHGGQGAEPLDGRFRYEAVVAQLLLQGLLDRGRLARRGLDRGSSGSRPPTGS